MTILELHTLTSAQIDDFQALMHELDPGITVTPEMLERAVNAPETHLFEAVGEDGTSSAARPCVSSTPLPVGKPSSRISWWALVSGAKESERR